MCKLSNLCNYCLHIFPHSVPRSNPCKLSPKYTLEGNLRGKSQQVVFVMFSETKKEISILPGAGDSGEIVVTDYPV